MHTFFYIVFQVLRVFLIKICQIQLPDLLFLSVLLARFYISWYDFSKTFQTSFNNMCMWNFSNFFYLHVEFCIIKNIFKWFLHSSLMPPFLSLLVLFFTKVKRLKKWCLLWLLYVIIVAQPWLATFNIIYYIYYIIFVTFITSLYLLHLLHHITFIFIVKTHKSFFKK